MALIEKFKLEGARELHNALIKMEQQVQVSIVRKSIRKSMVPVRNSLALNIAAKLDTMNPRARAIYSRQIQIRTKMNKRKGYIAAYIMPNVKKMQTAEKKRAWREAVSEVGNQYEEHSFTNFAYLAHFFETGTKPHVIRQRKRNIKMRHPGIKGNPLFQNVYDAKAKSSATLFIEEMHKNIAKEFNRNK